MRPIIAHLSEDLVVAFKQKCAEEDRSMKSVIEASLRRYVSEGRDAKPDDVLFIARKDVERLLHSPLA